MKLHIFLFSLVDPSVHSFESRLSNSSTFLIRSVLLGHSLHVRNDFRSILIICLFKNKFIKNEEKLHNKLKFHLILARSHKNSHADNTGKRETAEEKKMPLLNATMWQSNMQIM